MYLTNESSKLKYSQEEVNQLGLQTVSLLQRDAAELAVFGIDQTAIDKFKTLSDSFNQRDFDRKFVLKLMDATEKKDILAEAIRLSLHNIGIALELERKSTKRKLKVFNFGAVSNDTDYELAAKAKLCVNVLTEKVEEFADFGLTQALLDALSNLADDLRRELDNQKLAEYGRTDATQDRTLLANELYSEMMKYRTLGRKMWIVKDYAKAQSYVLPKKSYPLTQGTDPTGTGSDSPSESTDAVEF